MKWINILLELTKVKISLFSTLSTFSGFALAGQGLSQGLILTVLGVFFLASGSCALNQYQERQTDHLMERTRRRPIPSKKLSPSSALKISIGFLLLGSILLYEGARGTGLLFGLTAVFMYNGVYPLLKRKTAFAAIPGALIGAIPPWIGWVSGKGILCFAPQILAVSFFFFIWQVPHFWLLLLNSGRDYEKAGLPALVNLFSLSQLSRMTFVWIFAASTACLMIPVFGVGGSQVTHGCFILMTFWLLWKSVNLLVNDRSHSSFPLIFKTINSYAILVVVLITLDPLFH